jgi:hypothetical protein
MEVAEIRTVSIIMNLVRERRTKKWVERNFISLLLLGIDLDIKGHLDFGSNCSLMRPRHSCMTHVAKKKKKTVVMIDLTCMQIMSTPSDMTSYQILSITLNV